LNRDVLLSGSRRRFFDIWQKMKLDEPLEGEEAIIGKVMLDHREFHNTWEFADLLDDVEYDVNSEANPYLHVVMHSIVENQLRLREPREVRYIYKLLKLEGLDKHEIIHEIGAILIIEIIRTMQIRKAFNNKRYIHKLKKMVLNVRKNCHA